MPRLGAALLLLLSLGCFCGHADPEAAARAPYVDADGLTVLATFGNVDPVPPHLALTPTDIYVGLYAREDARVVRVPRAGGAVQDLGAPGANLRALVVDAAGLWVATDTGLYRPGPSGFTRVGSRTEWRALARAGVSYLAAKDQLVRMDDQGAETVLATFPTPSFTWQLTVLGDRLYYSRWGTEREVGWVPVGGGATTVLTRESAPDSEPLGLWGLAGELVWPVSIGSEIVSMPMDGGALRTRCDAHGFNAVATDGVSAWLTTAKGSPGIIGKSSRAPYVPIYSKPGGEGGLFRCTLTTGAISANLAPALVRPRVIAADSAGVVLIDSEDGRLLSRATR